MTGAVRALAALLLLALAAIGSGAMAAEHVIQMRSSGAQGAMVFEPAFLRVAVGDVVVFRTTQGGGHHSESVLVPQGGKAWHGEIDAETRVRLEAEGVYLYLCEPHLPMGMVGVVQAGRPVNLKAARKVVAEYEAKIVLNPGRFTAALRQAN